MRKNKDLFSIFPADAGVNLPGIGLLLLRLNIPRGCGGEPGHILQLTEDGRYSPRMRG